MLKLGKSMHARTGRKSNLFRIRKLLSNRLVGLAATVTVVLAMLLGTTGTANAAIYWDNPSIQMVNQADQQCLAGVYDFGPSYPAGETVPGCMARGTSWIRLESGQADASGQANVQIMTESGSGTVCLGAVAGEGPSQIQGSAATRWETCEFDRNNWDQIWTMATAAPVQNVGNPAVLKHFINFYNGRYKVCLDGGIGVYGFPGGCSTTNNWQVWKIYTNQTSEPWRGF
ncbi:hypothetical protein ABZ646_27525 [Streptomyces sp. NPDC007162]|uniref:hypothetical protein n=1 Tax=Streptomyces sp. NPDC007162 TaxID=3156917 RepID=UPI0033D28CE1